jgi:hypothetical protein
VLPEKVFAKLYHSVVAAYLSPLGAKMTSEENFAQYWEYEDSKGRKVIKLKQLPFLQSIYLKIWKRFTVKELYLWTATAWSKPEMMHHEIPIKHDNFKFSKHVEKQIPRGYQLTNGWCISNESIRYLRRGPLISESGETILVQPYSFFAKWFLKFERHIAFWGSIASIIAFIVCLLK